MLYESASGEELVSLLEGVRFNQCFSGTFGVLVEKGEMPFKKNPWDTMGEESNIFN